MSEQKNANVILILDTTQDDPTYVENMKIGTTAFIDQWLIGDGLGVSQFNTTGEIVYANGSTIAIVGEDRQEIADAKKEVEDLQFDLTDAAIGEGIETSKAVMELAPTNPRAFILLTDGNNEDELDPLDVLPDYPIYTCGIGDPQNINMDLLREIAAETGGKCYISPTPQTLMIILNEIRNQPVYPGGPTVNKVSHVLPNDYDHIQADILPDNESILAQVVWDDTNYTYVDSSQPGTNEMNVVLYTPDLSPIKPDEINEGSVTFNQIDPDAGAWRVEVLAGKKGDGSGEPFQTTTLIFEQPRNLQTSPILNVSVKTGQSDEEVRCVMPNLARIDIYAQVHQNGQTITDLGAVEMEVITASRCYPLYPHEITPGEGVYKGTIHRPMPGGYIVTVRTAGQTLDKMAPFERMSLVSFQVQ